MNLNLKVTSDSYEGVQSQLVIEAERFYGARRFGFAPVQVEMDENLFTASAMAYEVTEPRHRPGKADVPAEEWDPFVGQFNSYDPF